MVKLYQKHWETTFPLLQRPCSVNNSIVLGRYFCPRRSENRAGHCSACLRHFRSSMCKVCPAQPLQVFLNQIEALWRKQTAKFSYSRQFMSPCWQHRPASFDVPVDPRPAPRLVAASPHRSRCWGEPGMLWPHAAFTGDRAALGLQYTDVWGPSGRPGPGKRRKRDPTVGAVARAERNKMGLARVRSPLVSLLPNGGRLTGREEVEGPEWKAARGSARPCVSLLFL